MSTTTTTQGAARSPVAHRTPEVRQVGRLAGTGVMVRLALRRDRVLMPVWILVFAGMASSSAAAAIGLYPTVESRRAVAETANATPALVAMYGRIYNTASLGGIAMLKMMVLGSVLVAVLMIIFLVRHTRAEEESGRLELMRAGVLGRSAPLAAALVVTVGSSLLLGAVTAAGLVASGLDTSGSVAFGLAWACAGTTFAAVAAVTAQVSEGTRTATGLSLAVLGVAYVLRAVGDTASAGGPRWLSGLSPLGWSQQIRPYAGDRWWVALAPAAVTAAAVVLAFALVARRDLGAGLVRPRPGPARGAASLRSPLALAWRLHRGQLLAWTLAFALLGLVLGGITANVGSLLDSPQSRDMVTTLGGVQGLTDAFLGTEIGFAGVIAAAFGVQAAARLRSEETALRAEPLLATSVTRSAWLASHLLVALGGTTVLMLVTGLTVGLTHGADTGDMAGALTSLIGATLVRLPSVWVLTGVAVALFGLVPRLVTAAWVALVVFLVLGELGPVLGLPAAVTGASPFAHVPSLPGGQMHWTPTIALAVLAAVLLAAGMAGFRRRDIG